MALSFCNLFVLVCAVVCVILIQLTESYKMCYSCNRIPFPRDCNHITTCSDNENCFTRQYISDSGHVLYDSGCISKQRCLNIKRDIRYTTIDDVSTDIVTCIDCCESEMCNSQGCNSEALPDRTVRGPVCFSCSQQQSANSCEIISICQHSEVCSLKFNVATITGDPIYSSGCIRSEVFQYYQYFDYIYYPSDVEIIGLDLPVWTEQTDIDLSFTNTYSCASALSVHTWVYGSWSTKFCDSIDTISTSTMGFADSGTCTGCCKDDYCNRNCSSLGRVTTGPPLVYTTTPSHTTKDNPRNHVSCEEKLCETATYTFNETLGICYKLFTNVSFPWQQSRDVCRRAGGDLIVFHSIDEELFFEEMTKEIYTSKPKEARFWVGATDVLTEMKFLWLDGHTVDPGFFHPNEPNNAFDGEDCLAATLFDNSARRVLLNDDDCSLPSHFVCELDMKTLQDTHSAHGARQGPCSNGDYTYSSEVNMCYKVFTDRLTMTEARERCEQDEAGLLILRDLQEELYFQRLPFHDTNNDHRYWVGGSRTPNDEFEWFDGTRLKPTLQWFAGEPNNYNNNESCISLTYFDGNREQFYLNDDNCAKQLYFICEEKCPDTTYRYIPSLDLCYKIYNESVTWSGARDRCQKDKATLAEVDTMSKLAFFQLILEGEAHTGGHKYWVGASITTNGDFHWLTTDHVVSSELWHSTEPSIPSEPSMEENCVALHWYPAQYGNVFKLNNRPCDVQDRFVCQYIRGVQ